MDRPPQHAVFARSPHLHDPTGTLVAWFTEPAGALIQISRLSEFTVEMATWLVEVGSSQLLARFPGTTPLVIVLDLRLMTKRQPAVRSLLVEAAKKLGPRLGCGFVIPPENSSKVYLASIHAAAAALRVFGAKVEIVESLPSLVAEKRLRAAR
jgi:hypothetical protein